MSSPAGTDMKLEINAKMDNMPVLLAFVAAGASALGLQKRELDQLVLGSEEIFSYICGLSAGHDRIQGILHDGAYYVRLALVMDKMDIPWEAFNLSVPVIRGEDQEMEELGLMLAARFLDGLEVESQTQRGIAINLIKDKVYPVAEAGNEGNMIVNGSLAVSAGDPGGIKQLCGLVQQYYPAVAPSFCRTPGRLVDMAASGDYRVLLARDSTQQLAGGIIWHWLSPGLVEFFGPYPVPTESPAAILLAEHLLSSLARSSAVALFSRAAPEAYPAACFEEMGRWQRAGSDGSLREQRSIYRLLHEDNGAVSWFSPVLQPFVEEASRRLNLPRRFCLVENQGERVEARSAFLSRLERQGARAIIRPLQTGRDAKEVIASYVQVLRNSDFTEIEFELDLGQAEHGELGAALLAAGFQPVHLLPYGARGDLLVFHYQANPSRN